MEDVKIMVKDCLGPLPRVCQEQVLLDMERSRMMAEDSRCRLNEALEAFRNSENQRTACEGDFDIRNAQAETTVWPCPMDSKQAN